MLVS
jgi:hypothetical protein